MNRIAVICIAIAGAMVGTSACVAETYPTKPVRMVVSSIAGGNADIQARYIAERLRRLGSSSSSTIEAARQE
jgi:tripartite-type tricarboxylate transporter receptor subunit TctC